MGQVTERFAAELARVRPGLSTAYAAALPGARSAVLGRLWRGLLYEPVPGMERPGSPVPGVERPGSPVPAAPAGEVVLRTSGGRLLRGRARTPYDLAGEPALWLDGRRYDDPAALLEALLAALDLPGTDRPEEDLDNSVASLALSRAGAATRPARPAATPEDHEQDVIDGHPYHPCCRNRPGVSVAEQLAYMPEHRPVVALDLLAVPAAGCLVSGPWPDALRDGDRLLLPVHPWQAEHVLAGLGLRPYATGAIRARPLMSVRTLAPLDGGPHLKTALSIRLTSDVRDISPGSIRDCVTLSRLLTDLSARLGGRPRVARYLAGAAAPVKGEVSADVSVMLREPAAALAPNATVLPVAAITRETAGDDPAGWLAAFARLAFADVLGLLALGAALEAHGQNLLLVLDGRNRPARLVYRDLADIRLSPARLARHGIEVPPLSARLLSDDPDVLRAKAFGSLVGTTFGSLISLFGKGDRAAESRLWAVVSAAAREVSRDLPDRDALFAPTIPAKAHLVALLAGAGDSWTRLPNPLAPGI
ncbi:MAG TPA: IucA/IucC family protein [Nonomuraea sp.]|nr:IucA/IucC family protein [Nonomuraea sp.]